MYIFSLSMMQVLEKALGVWDLQVIPFSSPVAEASNYDPELETAFICHLHDHWFCVRKVNSEWYNFNSLYAAPEHLSKFYLSAFLDTLRGSGWSIFIVRGNFPKDCPIPLSNAFGQWLTPEDAERITKSCNEMEARPQRREPSRAAYSDQFMNEADVLAAQEEHDLNAAIAASLMDSSAFTAGTSSVPDYGASPASPAIGSDSVAIAASLLGSAFSQGSVPIQGPGNLVCSAAVGSPPNANESGGNDPQTDINASDGSMATISSDPSEAREPKPSKDKDQ